LRVLAIKSTLNVKSNMLEIYILFFTKLTQALTVYGAKWRSFNLRIRVAYKIFSIKKKVPRKVIYSSIIYCTRQGNIWGKSSHLFSCLMRKTPSSHFGNEVLVVRVRFKLVGRITSTRRRCCFIYRANTDKLHLKAPLYESGAPASNRVGAVIFSTLTRVFPLFAPR